MTKTVLITGGAGFIGSHVADRFINDGYRTIVVDNLSSGKAENLNAEGVFYPLDITHHEELDNIFQKEKPDFVLHFAAQVSASFSNKHPRNDAQQNIMDLISVLDCSRKHQIQKIFFASSAAVYGNNLNLPLAEEENAAPVNFYGLTKAFGEGYVQMYHQIFGLPYLIGRFSNVYGERQNTDGESGVIALFTHAAAHNKGIVIEGDGQQTRDFLYVGDLANLIFATFNKAENEIINFATGSSVSINKVVDAIRKQTETLEVKYVAPRIADIQDSCLANEKLKQYINCPFVPLEAGLKQTLHWYATL